jgi:fermentation-respiration switch protein FrsA (DUF1100 family)
MRIGESEIILMGRSLGGAVAVDLAARDGARALILASTFTSLPDVGAKHLSWMLPQLNMTMRLDSLSKIRKYEGPLFVSHGDADEVIPFSQGEKLYQVAAGPKQFFREPGGKHNDAGSREYENAFEQFLISVDSSAHSSEQ